MEKRCLRPFQVSPTGKPAGINTSSKREAARTVCLSAAFGLQTQRRSFYTARMRMCRAGDETAELAVTHSYAGGAGGLNKPLFSAVIFTRSYFGIARGPSQRSVGV